jgi:hypothetical protein
MSGTGDIVVAMILCTSVPLLLYGTLIAALRTRRDKTSII